MNVINSLDLDSMPINSYCAMCGKSYFYYGSVKRLNESFCSDYCIKRYSKLQREGYPIVSQRELDFWVSTLGLKFQWKQGFRGSKLKKEAQKLVIIGVQKVAQLTPYIRGEPLNPDPHFDFELEPVLINTNFEDISKKKEKNAKLIF